MKSEQEITQALMEPFPRELIKQRQGGGNRMLDYIEGHEVIKRLIEATDNHFDVRVISLNLDPPIATATVEITIPGLGSRQHIGVQAINPEQRGTEDLAKGAITDGIKKVATLFGVALDLYEMTVAHAAPQRPAAPPPPRPIRPGTAPAPVARPVALSPDDYDGPPYEDLPPADARPSDSAPPMAATAAAPRPTASGERPATERQLNFVRALAARQGLDDDALKGLLVARCGTQHLHDLNAAEASALIEEFQGDAPATQAAPPKARPTDESATDWRREMAEAPSIEALAGVANRLLQAPVSDAEREHLRQVFRERRETLLAPVPGATPKRAPERDIPARRVNDAEMAALAALARAKGIAEPALDPFILKTLGARGSGGLRNLTLAACLQVQDHLALLADR